jgi:hypothetical protein
MKTHLSSICTFGEPYAWSAPFWNGLLVEWRENRGRFVWKGKHEACRLFKALVEPDQSGS